MMRAKGAATVGLLGAILTGALPAAAREDGEMLLWTVICALKALAGP